MKTAPKTRVFDYDEIDEFDEVSGNEVLVFAWCLIHRRYE